MDECGLGLGPGRVGSGRVGGRVARSIIVVRAGFESRQFLHADDAAAALGTMMQNYGSLEVGFLSVPVPPFRHPR